ncbi:uncharacterized protein [Asterias amurensis]|uniref:uncharacterized protein n=1 Tax=Asterias amurensis TaxID=7602 RepID=UPI003AB79C12
MDRTCRVKQFGIHGVYLVTVLILLVMVLDSVSAQTAGGVDGLCPNTVNTTVKYITTDKISRSHMTTTKCGLFNLFRCTVYRTVYSIEPRTATREIYNIVYVCCDGWETQEDGSCSRITTERASTEPALTIESTLDSSTTTPTYPVDVLSPESSSSSMVSPSSTVTSSGSPPAEMFLPEDVSSDEKPSFFGDKRMLGGIGGVVGALIILVTLMLLLITRRRRRSREKRNAEPGVLFELLTSNSPPQAPTPDIYTEIPDHQNNISSTGQETVTDQGQSDYDIAFVHNQRPSGRINTYQDVKDLVASCNGINEQTKTAVGNKGGASAKMESPAAAKTMESSVCLGQNGQVYTELDQNGLDRAEQAPYQNLTVLDTVIKAPTSYGNGRSSPAIPYNKLDRTNRVVPTDPDDEAYNTVIIGPTGSSEDAPYDKLERQRSAPHHGSEDNLAVSIPAGYAALGVNGSNLAYDKLERHEAQGFEPDRHVGKTTGPNTYDAINPTSPDKKTYDKLQRQHSTRGLNDSPAKTKSSDELPKSDNEYDTVEIGQPIPAGGEIYQNLPKKPKVKGQTTSPDLKIKASPVVRPLYDIVPGSSSRKLSAPVYDLVPTSPRENGIAPLYDIPPALSQQISHKESVEGPASPSVNQAGTRPVYDTPPLRLDSTSSLQFEETCPVYENTPTSRKQSVF